MMMVQVGNIWLAAVLVWCAACGRGSGVDGDRRLVELSESEILDLCKYFADVEGPERTIDCGAFNVRRGGASSVSGCVSSLGAFHSDYPGCEATVDQLEACVEATTDAHVCSGDRPPECAPLQTGSCSG
jgi:hypothetical protein